MHVRYCPKMIAPIRNTLNKPNQNNFYELSSPVTRLTEQVLNEYEIN